LKYYCHPKKVGEVLAIFTAYIQISLHAAGEEVKAANHDVVD
jgi:hypothetical protein